MDDLSGFDWSAKPAVSQPQPKSKSPVTNPFSSLRSAPTTSGINSPLSTQATNSSLSRQVSPKPQPQPQPQHDSFSNLMSFGPSSKTAQNLTLAERQAQLEAEKSKKLEETRRQTEVQFGSGNHWDALGSRGFTPSPAPSQKPAVAPRLNLDDDDDDLFAAFNRDTKVDNASHYPPPPPPKKGLDLSDPTAWQTTSTSTATTTPASTTTTTTTTKTSPDTNGYFGTDGGGGSNNDDDDPFGLNDLQPPASSGGFQSAPSAGAADDFDFLGDLARPVEEIRREQEAKQQAALQATQRPSRPRPGMPIEDDSSSSSSSDDDEPIDINAQRSDQPRDDLFDKAVAQLVDYGFSAEQARRGLVESGAGYDAQAAANWLLDDAHRKSKDRSQGRREATGPSSRSQRDRSPRAPAPEFPSVMGEIDLAKQAAAMGNSLFKSANSLWKTGQRKVQQAVAELQQDGDIGQPRWMREVQHPRTHSQPRAQPRAPQQSAPDVTDEAMMLESGQGPPQATRSGGRHPSQQQKSSRVDPRAREDSPAASASPGPFGRNSPAPRWQQQSQAPPAFSDARSRLDKLKIDDDDSFAISTSNRRRKASPASDSQKLHAEPDLLFNTQAPKPPASAPPQQTLRQSPAPTASRPPAAPAPRKATPKPVRQVPALSPDALQRSTTHRHQGTAHFKRGDFASAHASYTTAISPVPSDHPLMIILLTNRALTALKTGEPREAVANADEALRIIGPGNGQGETVAVRNENGQDEQRDMKDLYGKALSRKAEALEQMEKWADAGTVWQSCVEAGVGGATAIKGRQRCQEALSPKPKAVPKPAAARPRPPPSASLAPRQDSEAVTRLREANEAAARADDEKFALSDKVDARVSAWRDGKRENLRALISSLDNVLWEDSGWKTVGLHELLQANRVKISYMKAIAKTHPDKLPQDASTEVRLIAGLVFSTLNESWDKFKADNGL